MDSTTERRAPGATRIPFDALVEVGDAGGQPFEAQALDLSHHGMHLRTAYLPEMGQSLSCRFEAGTASVICEGEVAWLKDGEPGGEFGLRFTNLDAESAAGLKQILSGAQNSGCKVRLHIEGLASPMRARIKDTHGAKITATSELGFLQLGKGVELENANDGTKRAAHIDRVEVEIDPTSHVPQLVVAMRYDDVEDTSAPMTAKDGAPETKKAGAKDMMDVAEKETEESPAKKATNAILAKGAMVGPVMMDWMNKAKGSATTWWKNRTNKDSAKNPQRRTTAAAPSGGMPSQGRKMRSQSPSIANATDVEETSSSPAMAFATKNKRRIAIGAVAITAGILGYAALHKSTPAQTTATAETTTAMALEPSPAPSASSPVLPARGAGVNAPIAMSQPLQGLPALGNPAAAAPAAPAAPAGGAMAMNGPAEEPAPLTPTGKPMPFGHGNVTGGKVLKFKMDGNIGRIQGASQPTGFTVVIPQRKSLTSGPSAMKQDKRIALMKVSNDPGGAEMNVTFKDGVPPYLVRANKDVLEVVLGAPSGEDKKNGATAEAGSGKKHGGKKASHGKKH